MDHWTAIRLASDMVKSAGFVLAYPAMNSETCYYRHPAVEKDRLLRISTHKGKGRIGHTGAVAKVTCGPRNMHLTAKTVENQVIYAIGRYFLTTPKPSAYRGRRGTWEHQKETSA